LRKGRWEVNVLGKYHVTHVSFSDFQKGGENPPPLSLRHNVSKNIIDGHKFIV